ncbi:MAG TPA: hypothetical protein VFN42_11000 [Acetobacteraceae bacterium]|nr:hypothetical protein [Acetobacteraceae bacterium]
MNDNFIKPDGTAWEYEASRFESARHLQLLRQAGFAAPDSLQLFEHELDTPTAAK